MSAPVETTDKQLKDRIENDNVWMYEYLHSRLDIKDQVMLDSIVLSANFKGYAEGLDYAYKKMR